MSIALVLTKPDMELSVVRGSAADALLADASFVRSWKELCDACAWATSFQRPEFAATWYAVYRRRFEPLLVLARDSAGSLLGLLPLATPVGGGDVVVAGARQAEYQAWVARDGAAAEFATRALERLRAESGTVVRFRYLPSGMPLDVLRADPHCKLTAHRRPLLSLGPEAGIGESLRKKGNRSRLNRLRKLGDLEFRRLVDPSELEPWLDEITACHDLRQGAVHGGTPFFDDARKRAFHVELLRHPEVLHATITTVGGRFAAAHLGIRSGAELQLGILAHRPELGRHSPGKFHIFFLARLLDEAGLERIDLTPGGDPYKERFANAFDEVHELVVYPSTAHRRRAARRARTFASVKRALRTLGVDSEHAAALRAKLARFDPIRTPRNVARQAIDWVGRTRELRIYSFDAAAVVDEPCDIDLHRDEVADLLAYTPGESWQTRQQFLATAQERLESGTHAYTVTADGRLLHYGWLIERQSESFASEVRQSYTFPPDSACLFDYYTSPEARGRGLYTRSLRRMLRDAARIPGTRRIFITVLADNGPSRHVIERVGFEHVCSLFERVRFGRQHRWREDASPDSGRSSRSSVGTRVSGAERPVDNRDMEGR